MAAEEAGFSGIGFTDHPAPSERWLAAGGHDALDPLAALAFCAAVTDRLRLIPNILVLPYRNPFLVAKAGATLDALSGGRFTLAVATGYLRAEYQALGVDFDQRNALFDEAIEVILGVWTENDFAHQGTTFTAKGQTANPKPDPLPPIWVGGNSRLSRQRVARYGQGWSPFPAPRSLARTTKSTPLESLDDLRPMLDELWQFVEEAGRDPAAIDVSFGSGAGGDPAADRLQRRRAAGGRGRAGRARGHLVRRRCSGGLGRPCHRDPATVRGVGHRLTLRFRGRGTRGARATDRCPRAHARAAPRRPPDPTDGTFPSAPAPRGFRRPGPRAHRSGCRLPP